MSQQWILIVEDNPDEAQLIGEAFNEIAPDIEVIGAACGTDALARLSGLGENEWPSLIVTDRHLPDFYGEALIAKIRAHPQAKGVVLVIISGGMTPSPGLGAVDWYEKPSTWSAWCAWAKSLVGRHLTAGH